MHNFKELIVWQKARELVKDIYLLTEEFPKEEKYGLASQIRRACISIASNIAEGSGRDSHTEFCRYLEIANGSAFELETQLILAKDLNLIPEQNIIDIDFKLTEIQKILFAFKKRLRNNK